MPHDESRRPGIIYPGRSSLAIELAADRAFGPNRRLQHSLLEVALSVFDDPLPPERLQTILGHIQRLSAADQHEIILPLLKKRLDRLSTERLGPIVQVIQYINKSDDGAKSALEKMASIPALRAEAMRIFLASARPDSCDPYLLKVLSAKLDSHDLDQLVTGARGERLFIVLQLLRASGLPDNRLSYTVARSCRSGGFAFSNREDSRFLRDQISREWPPDPIDQAIRCLVIIGYLTRHNDWARVIKEDRDWDLGNITLPQSIRSGQLGDLLKGEPFASYPELRLSVWMIHLLLGDVTTESSAEFIEFFRAHRHSAFVGRMLGPLPADLFPCFDLLVTCSTFKPRPPWKKLAEVFEQFSGTRGQVAWESVRAHLQADKSNSTRRDRSDLFVYGFLGIVDAKRRSHIIGQFNNSFGALFAEYVFFKRTSPYPETDSGDGLDRLIANISSDRMLTAPRVTAIRRSSCFAQLLPQQKRHNFRGSSRFLWTLGRRPDARASSIGLGFLPTVSTDPI